MPDSQLWGSPAPAQPLPHRRAWGTPIWRPGRCPQDCCQVSDLFRLYFGGGYFCVSFSVLLTDRLQKHQDQLVLKPAYKAKRAVAARQPLCAAGQRLPPEPAAVLGRLLPAAESRLPQTGTALLLGSSNSSPACFVPSLPTRDVPPPPPSPTHRDHRGPAPAPRPGPAAPQGPMPREQPPHPAQPPGTRPGDSPRRPAWPERRR